MRDSILCYHVTGEQTEGRGQVGGERTVNSLAQWLTCTYSILLVRGEFFPQIQKGDIQTTAVPMLVLSLLFPTLHAVEIYSLLRFVFLP